MQIPRVIIQVINHRRCLEDGTAFVCVFFFHRLFICITRRAVWTNNGLPNDGKGWARGDFTYKWACVLHNTFGAWGKDYKAGFVSWVLTYYRCLYLFRLSLHHTLSCMAGTFFFWGGGGSNTAFLCCLQVLFSILGCPLSAPRSSKALWMAAGQGRMRCVFARLQHNPNRLCLSYCSRDMESFCKPVCFYSSNLQIAGVSVEGMLHQAVNIPVPRYSARRLSQSSPQLGDMVQTIDILRKDNAVFNRPLGSSRVSCE